MLVNKALKVLLSKAHMDHLCSCNASAAAMPLQSGAVTVQTYVSRVARANVAVLRLSYSLVHSQVAIAL